MTEGTYLTASLQDGKLSDCQLAAAQTFLRSFEGICLDPRALCDLQE